MKNILQWILTGFILATLVGGFVFIMWIVWKGIRGT